MCVCIPHIMHMYTHRWMYQSWRGRRRAQRQRQTRTTRATRPCASTSRGFLTSSVHVHANIRTYHTCRTTCMLCMYVCMHACMHACIHTYVHTYRSWQHPRCMHTYMNSYMYAYSTWICIIFSYMYAYSSGYVFVYVCTQNLDMDAVDVRRCVQGPSWQI